jgi:hypothetical protein
VSQYFESLQISVLQAFSFFASPPTLFCKRVLTKRDIDGQNRYYPNRQVLLVRSSPYADFNTFQTLVVQAQKLKWILQNILNAIKNNQREILQPCIIFLLKCGCSYLAALCFWAVQKRSKAG